MKRLLSLLVIGLLAISQAKSSSQDDVFKRLTEARQLAKKSGHLIMLDFETEWCGFCKEMDKKTLPADEVKEYMSSNIILVKVDAESDSGRYLAMKYRISGYPTFLFVDDKLRVAGGSFGYQEPADFVKTLQEMRLNQANGKFYTAISPQIKLAFPDFYKKRFNKNGKRVYAKPEVVNQWLSKRKTFDDEVTFSILATHEIPTKYVQYVVANQKRLRTMYGDENVNAIFSRAVDKQYRALLEKPLNDLKKWLPSLSQYGFPEGDRMQNWYLRNYLLHNKLWDEYFQALSQAVEDQSATPTEVNATAWDLYEKEEDVSACKGMLPFMETICDKHKDYNYWDTYAALLLKCGISDLGREWANKAIQLGKSLEMDVSGTEKLLERYP